MIEYVANVRIRTERRVYLPGELLDRSSVPDMDYLIGNGFVKKVYRGEAPGMEPNQGEPDEPGEEPDIPDEEPDPGVPELYTEEQLKKMRSKRAIVEYAESIGLSGLDESLNKGELIDKVLVYIEEVMKDDVPGDDQ